MYARRRYWTIAALGGMLVLLAWVVDRSLPLYGAAGIGAWLLATQYTGMRSFDRTDRGLDIELSLARGRTTVEQEVHATLTVERTVPTSETITVTVPTPPAATGPAVERRRVQLNPDEVTASTSFGLTFPVAGRFTLPTPEVEFVDETRQFGESITRGDPPTVTVHPRQPRNVHIGQGGDEIAAAYGEHPAGQSGAGLTPVELRRYVTGDAVSRIDWKATARLDYPHVREFEAETDRQTLLLIDHSAAMAIGPKGETMLDYAREVALGIVNTSEEYTDPLGLYTVGDEGTTARHEPTTASRQYQQIREVLRALTSTTTNTSAEEQADDAITPAEARERRQRLADGGSAFATKLRPFWDGVEPYVQRVGGDPLSHAIQQYQTRQSGSTWTMLLTSDSDRARLREVVSLASQGGDHVLVFLTPRVLYEADGLTDLEAAYDRYLDFEKFRRELDSLSRVTAFEVGPGDRLDALLAARQERR